MFDRISMGWRMAMAAFGVLRENKKLLVFPLLSGICCLLVLASFAAPLVMSERLRDLVNERQVDDPIWYVVLFAFYLVNYFVIVFFNSALVSCALAHFNGMEATIGDGLRAAASRLPQIFAWAVVSATVGVILKIIEDRSDKVGQFVVGLLGMAWGVVTFFVVPVLVVERLGPVGALKRSTALVRKAWGESLVANFSAGLLIFLLFLAALVPAILGGVIGGPAILIGFAVTVVLMIVVSLISSAVNTIIMAALYEYAAYEKTPHEFDVNLLHSAFATK